MCVDRDVLLYRSYLAQNKFGVVKQEIKPSSPQMVQPLKTLAEYLQVPQVMGLVYTELSNFLAFD